MRIEPRIAFDATDQDDLNVIKKATDITGVQYYFEEGLHPITQFEIGGLVKPERIHYAIKHVVKAQENMAGGFVNPGATQICPSAKLTCIRQLDIVLVVLRSWLAAYANLTATMVIDELKADTGKQE